MATDARKQAAGAASSGKPAREAKAASRTPMTDAVHEPKSALRENFESIIVAVLFAVFVRAFIAQPYKIPSGSMEDTLLVGDHLVVDKLAFGSGASHDGPWFLPMRKIRRGDVVIFRPPVAPPVVVDESSDFIKRVIGLPNEHLTLTYDRERNGVTVAVDGKPLPENFRIGHFTEPSHQDDATWTVTMADEPPEPRAGWLVRDFQLGPDEYFMMGDNRNNSADSRFWRDHYAVKAERIRGLARFVYWSYDTRDGDAEPQGLQAQLARYASIIVHFLTRSRWSRTFMTIR